MWCLRQVSLAGNLRLSPCYLVAIQTGEVLLNKRGAGFDPKKDEGRLHFALGITEKGPGFRKNGNEGGDQLPDDRPPFVECYNIALRTSSFPQVLIQKCALGTEQLS